MCGEDGEEGEAAAVENRRLGQEQSFTTNTANEKNSKVNLSDGEIWTGGKKRGTKRWSGDWNAAAGGDCC